MPKEGTILLFYLKSEWRAQNTQSQVALVTIPKETKSSVVLALGVSPSGPGLLGTCLFSTTVQNRPLSFICVVTAYHWPMHLVFLKLPAPLFLQAPVFWAKWQCHGIAVVLQASLRQRWQAVGQHEVTGDSCSCLRERISSPEPATTIQDWQKRSGRRRYPEGGRQSGKGDLDPGKTSDNIPMH